MRGPGGKLLARRPPSKDAKAAAAPAAPVVRKKEMRVWDDSPLDRESAAALDRSADKGLHIPSAPFPLFPSPPFFPLFSHPLPLFCACK